MQRSWLRPGRLITFCAAIAAPATAFAALTEAPLTNTSQIIAPGPGETLMAAVNFRYAGSQPDAAGPVNGITFTDIDPRGGIVGLNTGVGVDVQGIGTGPADDRSRSQNTAATISGPDDANLESIANTINYIGQSEISLIHLEGLATGQPGGDGLRVQIIGGDAGSGIQNWFGELTITANGTTVGTWHAGDDNDTTASIVTFDAVPNNQGVLDIELTVNNPPPPPGANGSFAGYGAMVVTLVPEPASAGLLALGGLLALRRRRPR